MIDGKIAEEMVGHAKVADCRMADETAGHAKVADCRMAGNKIADLEHLINSGLAEK